MLLLHCSAHWEPWAHEHLRSRRTARWPCYCIAEHQIGPAGLTTRWICAEANPEQPPSPPKFNTMFPISILWAVVRSVQAHRVLQFTLWTPHKPASSCFHPFLVISSVLFPLPEGAHLFISPYSVTMGSQLTFKPSHLHPGALCQQTATGPISESQVTEACRGGLLVPLPIYLLSTHPTSCLQLPIFFPSASKTQQVMQLGLNEHSSSFILEFL